MPIPTPTTATTSAVRLDRTCDLLLCAPARSALRCTALSICVAPLPTTHPSTCRPPPTTTTTIAHTHTRHTRLAGHGRIPRAAAGAEPAGARDAGLCRASLPVRHLHPRLLGPELTDLAQQLRPPVALLHGQRHPAGVCVCVSVCVCVCVRTRVRARHRLFCPWALWPLYRHTRELGGVPAL